MGFSRWHHYRADGKNTLLVPWPQRTVTIQSWIPPPPQRICQPSHKNKLAMVVDYELYKSCSYKSCNNKKTCQSCEYVVFRTKCRKNGIIHIQSTTWESSCHKLAYLRHYLIDTFSPYTSRYTNVTKYLNYPDIHVLLHSDSLLLMDTLFRDSLKTQVHPKRIHL